jgi:hypothetical protein
MLCANACVHVSSAIEAFSICSLMGDVHINLFVARRYISTFASHS